MDWIADLEGMSLIVTADQERWRCDLSPSAELEIHRRDDEEERFDAFCFFGDFSSETEFPRTCGRSSPDGISAATGFRPSSP